MVRKLLLLLLIMLLFISFSSCSKWKVSNLTKNMLLNIELGTKPGQLDVDLNDPSFVNLTFDIRVSNGKIYCADNRQKRFQVFDFEGRPELILGPEKDENVGAQDDSSGEDEDNTGTDKSLEVVPFSFGYFGKFVADRNGLIYIQNTLLTDDQLQKSGKGALDFSPSNILVFNEKGKILYSLGKGGAADVPFYSLYALYSDDKSRLFVISKSYDNWSVERYDGKNRDFSVNFAAGDFSEEHDGEEYKGIVEDIVVFNSGTKMLVSVVFYADVRFKNRKIYEYLIDQQKLGRQVLELPDPRNELFTILEDKYMVLWDIEKQDLRFSIWSLQENIVNNLRIDSPGSDHLFQKVLADEQGNLYTMVLTDTHVEIKEWK